MSELEDHREDESLVYSAPVCQSLLSMTAALPTLSSFLALAGTREEGQSPGDWYPAGSSIIQTQCVPAKDPLSLKSTPLHTMLNG